MKFGDIVIFTENGVDYNATVLRERCLDSHSGSNGEPLLDLAFFKLPLKPNAAGKMAEYNPAGTEAFHSIVQQRIDVAHESHEYTESEMKKYRHLHGGVATKDHGFNVKYPGGRWKEQNLSTFTGSITDGDDFVMVDGVKKKKKKKLALPTGASTDTPPDDSGEGTVQ